MLPDTGESEVSSGHGRRGDDNSIGVPLQVAIQSDELERLRRADKGEPGADKTLSRILFEIMSAIENRGTRADSSGFDHQAYCV